MRSGGRPSAAETMDEVRALMPGQRRTMNEERIRRTNETDFFHRYFSPSVSIYLQHAPAAATSQDLT